MSAELRQALTDLDDLMAAARNEGIERFAVLGISQGGPVATTDAVRHPDRVSHLILYGSYARGWEHRDDPRMLRMPPGS